MSEYLDASVIVKWFKKKEENHEESMRILEPVHRFFQLLCRCNPFIILS